MATTTINTTGAEDARIVAAFGARLGLGRNATGPEVKQQIAQFVISVVQGYEQQVAAAAATAGVTTISPT